MGKGEEPLMAISKWGGLEGRTQLTAPTLSCGIHLHNQGFPALKLFMLARCGGACL